MMLGELFERVQRDTFEQCRKIQAARQRPAPPKYAWLLCALAGHRWAPYTDYPVTPIGPLTAHTCRRCYRSAMIDPVLRITISWG